jgi:hypothetical protein
MARLEAQIVVPAADIATLPWIVGHQAELVARAQAGDFHGQGLAQPDASQGPFKDRFSRSGCWLGCAWLERLRPPPAGKRVELRVLRALGHWPPRLSIRVNDECAENRE